jgi:hypothetical protein
MCNLHSIGKGQQTTREFARAITDRAGSLLPLLGVFPDYAAPTTRNRPAVLVHQTRSAFQQMTSGSADDGWEGWKQPDNPKTQVDNAFKPLR